MGSASSSAEPSITRPQVVAARDLSAPPKPPLAFRVGIVGHRPDRLQLAELKNLAEVMRDLLRAIKQSVHDFHSQKQALFTTDPPILRAVSALAEGSDRIFAEQALKLGYSLCCPMPFIQKEYEKDFSAKGAFEQHSLTRFHHILKTAKDTSSLTTIELDGRRANESAAYREAGRVVLNQSDFLFVVWDGERLNKLGGTEQTLAEARRMGIPILWISALAPHHWRFLEPTSSTDDPLVDAGPPPTSSPQIVALEKVVIQSLDVPQPAAKPPKWAISAKHRIARGPRVALFDYYHERKPLWNPAVLWRLFRDGVGDNRFRLPVFTVKDFETEVEDQWPRISPERKHVSQTDRLIDHLRPFYAWTDRLAVCYSDAYRSAFVLGYLLAAAAVGLALFPLIFEWCSGTHHGVETVCLFGELFAILTILLLVFYGRHRRWHERWIDYRLAAELIRHLRLTAPLGGARPFPQVPAHLATYGDPASTWAAWYARAVERDMGLAILRFTPSYLMECWEHSYRMIKGQLSFHMKNARRFARIEKRLHKIGNAVFAITLGLCMIHVALIFSHHFTIPEFIRWGMTFLSGVLPALGAALAGINTQGEFRRIAMRSEGMVERLMTLRSAAKSLKTRLAAPEAASPGQPLSVELSSFTSQAAQLMANEVLDWRAVFLNWPLQAQG